jgi:integrase
VGGVREDRPHRSAVTGAAAPAETNFRNFHTGAFSTVHVSSRQCVKVLIRRAFTRISVFLSSRKLTTDVARMGVPKGGRKLAHLTSQLVEQARRGTAPIGRYRDRTTPGLLLVVKGNSASSWILRYQLGGRRRDMGLGSTRLLGLARARELANARRVEIRIERRDPLSERQAERRGIHKRGTMFKTAMEDFLDANKARWKDPRAVDTWRNSLCTHAGALMALRVSEITADQVCGVLTPLWSSATPTAVKLRGRIEEILGRAKAQGQRAGENPARWKGGLDAMLPKPGRVRRKVKHHEALPFAQLPAAYKALAASDDLVAGFVRLCLLCASRPSEVQGATWTEIDFKRAVWRIPPERMKRDKLHEVPLSGEALDVLKSLPRFGDRVFPMKIDGAERLRVLRAAAGVDGITLHGSSRSGLADWAATNGYADRLIDYALSHYPADVTSQAYKRTGLTEERRPLMQAWGLFLRG